MKLDTEYSHIDICPDSGDRLTNHDIYWTDGVCPHCGHQGGTMTHYKQVVGRWNTPSLFERWFKGKTSEFITKEDEDKIMDILKGGA